MHEVHRYRAQVSLISPCRALGLGALMLCLSVGGLPAARAENKLVAIVNPQGNFLAEGLGTLLHAGPSFGGQLVWNWEFAQSLAQAKTQAGHGIDVDIVTQRVGRGSWPKQMGEPVTVVQPRSAKQGRIRIVRVPLGPDGSYLDKEQSYPELGAFAARLQRFYRHEGKLPELAYAAYADGAAVAEALRTAEHMPYIFHPHSLGIPKLAGMVERALARGADATTIAQETAPYNFGSRIAHERLAIAQALVVIANSNTEVSDQHLAHYGARARHAQAEGRYEPIPPGLKADFLQDAAAGHQSDTAAVARFEKDLLAGDVALDPTRKELPILFTYARPVPIKNISEFVRAVAMDPELLASHNVVVLAKAPEASDAKEVHDEWAKLNAIIAKPQGPDGNPLPVSLKGKVSIIGPRPQEEIAAVLRHLGRLPGSVHVNPALYEAFGLTVVEAMAAGLPVAATQNGGPSEHPYVETFPPTDHKQMAAAIRRAADPKRWTRLSQQGKRYGRSFNWQRTVNSHLAISAVANALDASPERAAVGPGKKVDAAQARQQFTQRERLLQRVLQRVVTRGARP